MAAALFSWAGLGCSVISAESQHTHLALSVRGMGFSRGDIGHCLVSLEAFCTRMCAALCCASVTLVERCLRNPRDPRTLRALWCLHGPCFPLRSKPVAFNRRRRPTVAHSRQVTRNLLCPGIRARDGAKCLVRPVRSPAGLNQAVVSLELNNIN